MEISSGAELGRRMKYRLTQNNESYVIDLINKGLIGREDICNQFYEDNRFAYRFAMNHKKYRDFILYFMHESKWVYRWAQKMGNRDALKYRICDEKYAFLWANEIGDHLTMVNEIKSPEWAYRWGKSVGNRKRMKECVKKDPFFATEWAYDIGDIEEMKLAVKEKGSKIDILRWNRILSRNSIVSF